jgi:hypothetical protein
VTQALIAMRLSVYAAWLGLLLGGPASADTMHGTNGSASRADPVTRVQSISPNRLELSDAASKQTLCAQVVVVANPAAACEVAQCIKAFESRKVKALEKGVRAIRVASCANPESRPMYLLWGSSSVLVLQPDRTGAGLWQQASSKSSKQLKMETEAAYGILSFERGRFRWLEHAE